MISFKQFLAEQNYPLYHGTSISSLNHIIKDNALTPGYDARDSHSQYRTMMRKGTTSTSRDRKFATYWSSRISGLWSDSDEEAYRTVVIELDRDKLRQRIKIIPYNHFPHEGSRRPHDKQRWLFGPEDYTGLDGNQYEERLVGGIKNISKYIVKIYLSPEADEFIQKHIPELYKKIEKWL